MANNSNPNSSSPPKQILVVDDDPSVRLLCTTSLKHAGYLVQEAEGSSEAMTLYTTSTSPIDLLLTDLFLPPPDFQLRSTKNRYLRVNGHDLVRQALSLKKELRVLVMSSHAFSSLAAQGITIEPERFLQKPFTVQQLLEQVAATLAAPPIRIDAPAASTPAQDIQWFD
jgi:CheY-like chemotaxis protein